MKKPLTLVVLLAMTTGNPLSAEMVRVQTVGGKSVEALPGQVLVRYKSGTSLASKNAAIKSLGAQSRRSLDAISASLLSVPAGETIESFMKKLAADPDVEAVEPNGVLRAVADPDDTKFPLQYNLQSAAAASINIQGAWAITTGTPTVVLADIDTGITLAHPDLQGNLWVNPSVSGNAGLHGTRIQLDWNNNGNCGETDGACSATTLGPEQCAGADPTDDNSTEYHGTRTAGIMAARTNNANGIAGICQNCQIMAVKALNSCGTGSFEGIAEGIIFAADHGASVINLSLGGNSGSDIVATAIQHAISKNVVVVAAAGNSGNDTPINFPASYDRVIAVGAIDSTNALADFSATGKALDLVAPGVNIVSTIASGTSASGDSGNDGTSFSAPMVSGVAGLIRSINPNLSVSDVTRYLDFTATDMGAGGFDTRFGFGRLNAGAAVQAANTGTVLASNPADSDKTFPYPNPYHPTEGFPVVFALPASLGTEGIKIDILNLAGEKIKTISGTNSWNGKNDDGNFVASGLYYYFAKTSKGDTKGKLTVIK